MLLLSTINYFFALRPASKKDITNLTFQSTFFLQSLPQQSVSNFPYKIIYSNNTFYSKQNVLLRFGVKNDLVFAMPAKSWMFKLNRPLNSSEVLRGPWRDLGGFHIFAFHCRWNQVGENDLFIYFASFPCFDDSVASLVTK